MRTAFTSMPRGRVAGVAQTGGRVGGFATARNERAIPSRVAGHPAIHQPAIFRVLAPAVPLFLAAAFFTETALAQSSHETIDDVSPKVVKIFGAGGLSRLYSYSTGFLVSPNGHIATVWSHVLDGDTANVVLWDGRRYEAAVLGAEPHLDLAVIKIDAENLPYFDLAETATAGPGTRVLAFSNMFKVAIGDEQVSVLHGVIAAKTTLVTRRGVFEAPYHGPVYVVDAITNNPGAGGGVLTTWDGRLLGMIGKELRNAQTNTWVNYVIPIGELKQAIEEIVSGKFTPRRSADEQLAEDSPERYGAGDFGLVLLPDVVYRTPAFIDRVLPNSPAAQAGLKRNDLVLFLNDQLIQSVRMLKQEFGRLESGGTLRLVVRRGDQLVTVELPVPRKE
jgi:serine protease Do